MSLGAARTSAVPAKATSRVRKMRAARIAGELSVPGGVLVVFVLTARLACLVGA